MKLLKLTLPPGRHVAITIARFQQLYRNDSLLKVQLTH